MRIAFYIVSILVCATLQTTIFQGLRVFDAVPILLLIFPMIVTIRRGIAAGCTIALICGLMMDMLGNQTIGVNALIFLQLCFFAGLFIEKFFGDKYFVVILLIFITCIVYSLLYFVLMFLIWGNGFVFLDYAGRYLSGSVYSAVVAIPMYAIYRRADKWICIRERGR